MAEEATKVEETVQEAVEQQEQKQPEQKVETPKEDDGVVKIDLRNLNQETDAVKE